MNSAGPVMLPDGAAVADLRQFAGRALRLDPGGVIRLVAEGWVLAAYCRALSGAGGPTVLALRTVALAEPVRLDLTVALESLQDRLSELKETAGQHIPLSLVSISGAGPAWAGVLPPRRGWSLEGMIEPVTLKSVAEQGIAEVSAETRSATGASAVAQLRARVWGRDLAAGSTLPAGAAFAADAYGFISDEAVTVHRRGAWWRLSLLRGHVLARQPGLG